MSLHYKIQSNKKDTHCKNQHTIDNLMKNSLDVLKILTKDKEINEDCKW